MKVALVYLLGAVALVVGMWFTSFVGLWGFDAEGRPSDGCVFWVWYWGPDDCPIRTATAADGDPVTTAATQSAMRSAVMGE